MSGRTDNPHPFSPSPADRFVGEKLNGFVPGRVFDVHAHLFHSAHFEQHPLSGPLQGVAQLGMSDYRQAASRWLPRRTMAGLFFGFPSRGNDRAAINRWVAEQLDRDSGSQNRALALVAPNEDPARILDQIRQFGFVGIKPYHVYAAAPETSDARVEDFAPEWMWEICDAINGVLMLHIMRPRAIADPDNQQSIGRLARKYPHCRVVLAHVARSFCYRHAREGLASMADLENVWVDTSAVTETEALRCAIQTLGPQRVMFGTDYPTSELHGRCVSIGDSFFWVHPDTAQLASAQPPAPATLIAIESLLCLREACEDCGLTDADIRDIFCNNAMRMLGMVAEERERTPATQASQLQPARAE